MRSWSRATTQPKREPLHRLRRSQPASRIIQASWSRRWPFDPPDEFQPALRARAERRAWRPEHKPALPARHYRAAARRIVRETGEDAPLLLDQLAADLARLAKHEAALNAAEVELTDAVRADRLLASGHRCKPGSNEMGEVELVPARYLYSLVQPRAINRLGELAPPLDEHGHISMNEILHPSGPYFVGITFDRREVLGIWPAEGENTPAAEDATDNAAALAARPKANRGRTYRNDDAPLIEEMRCMIKSECARNPADAALAVVGRAVGAGTSASKADRLARKYRPAHRD